MFCVGGVVVRRADPHRCCATVELVPIWDPDDAEQLTWRFKVIGDVVDFYDTVNHMLYGMLSTE